MLYDNYRIFSEVEPMLKKYFYIVLTIMLLLSVLTGCGDIDGNKTNTTNMTVSESTGTTTTESSAPDSTQNITETETLKFNVSPGSYIPGENIETSETTSTPESSSSPETTSTLESTSSPETTATPESTPILNPSPASGDRIVCYTSSGKSYHYTKNCSTLSRSKTIHEGKLSDVIKLGKDDPCDKCVK